MFSSYLSAPLWGLLALACAPRPAAVEPALGRAPASQGSHSEPASPKAETKQGGLGIRDSTGGDAPAMLQILQDELVIGDVHVKLQHEPKYRLIPEVRAQLPALMGLPVSDPQRLTMVAPSEVRPYVASIHPHARGAEIASALQSAAFGGLPQVRVKPYKVLGVSRVPAAPGVEPLHATLDWSEEPLVVVVAQDAVEFWRAHRVKPGEAPQKPRKLLSIATARLSGELAAALQVQCEAPAGCNPFAVSIRPDAEAIGLLAVFEAMSARPEFATPTSPLPRALLLIADVGSGPLSLGEGGRATVSGRLPPESIRKVVRANFGKLRKCYEEGLARDPSLTGKVTVRFVISRDGSVGAVSEGESTLTDRAVLACVLAGFKALKFPTPEGGIVTVVYPIQFAPD